MNTETARKLKYIFHCALILPPTLILLSQCTLFKNPSDTESIANESLPDNILIPDKWIMDSINNDVVSDNWYFQFDQPLLDQYVASALDSSNPGVVFRLARIEGSTAGIQIARSGRAVFMDYKASYDGFTQTDGPDSYVGAFTIPVSWEADLWGRIKAGILAANESMMAEVHQYSFTRQSIAASVARLYFDIGGIQRSLEIGQEFLEINERLIEVQEKREEVGIINMQDVYLARANVANIEQLVLVFENQLQEAIRQLEVIMGRYPANSLSIQWEPEDLNSIAQIDDPLSLISRRPDLASLEAQVRSAFYLSEQATLAKYPSLVITADPGAATTGGLLVGVGASLIGPILNGKLIRSKIAQANAFQRQVASLYGSAILDALLEVESTLNTEVLLRERLEFAKIEAEQSRLAYETAVEQYRVGQIDLFNALILQGQYQLAELKVVDFQRGLFLQRVRLYLALGGNIAQP